ncbi:MAG: hypothetical protein EA368_15060 [Leptolyngbya sp. DLM2.Bin27]|nr:MAG: hypothetical protein EA368_15060 [Leptolyngbya sp. DLM2.Bin27]
MSQKIQAIVDKLPTRGLTVRALKTLDTFAPGEWDNLVGFDNTIKTVTGETDEAMVQAIGERAITLFNDKKQGYQSALWLYQTVDSASGLLGAAALANRIGQDTFLGFLKNLSPKPEKAQTIDLTVKLVTEVVAFCKISGIPGDSLGDFLAALGDYSSESLIRMAALVSFDGIIPLGAEFSSKALGAIKGMGPSDLDGNQTFKGIKQEIPGNNDRAKLSFMTETFESTKGWMDRFVDDHNITQGGLVDNLGGFIEGSRGKLDYLGAFLDMSVKYYEHTGVQTLARRLVERAVAEI